MRRVNSKYAYWKLHFLSDRFYENGHNFFVRTPNEVKRMIDVKGKTKDNPKARMDIKEYCRRKELWLQELQNGKIVKPKASFSFTLDEKRETIEWVLESSLDRMEENILVTTTKLEKIFPCGFFDVMGIFQFTLYKRMYPFERPNRNDEGDIDPLFPPISIFNQNGRGSKKRGKRGFTDMEMQSAVTHILLNCPEIQSYVKNKKTNNSGVYIQGDVDGTDQTIEYYGVIQEIIEVRYSEISENKENESFDDEEWDDNGNETTEEEEWENDGIETSEDE
ncbi:hypothetical protein MTR67_043110 [Solanum verrucosum]|uniref:Uncharacterized protein n=1 Tax=Solanum verrucosum TaxID=315347 RepID=A0AAF0UPP4_SOLVR|nr:hypothetical protein MTR67_043110 [Solanum verrucosum]